MSPTATAQRLIRRLRRGGLRWVAGAVWDRVCPPRVAACEKMLRAVSDGNGLEIGGPSKVFGRRGFLPVYERAGRIDNVNFAGSTAWESDRRDGAAFRFHPDKPPGTQWIREAGALAVIADATCDFVLSSHCLEHLANPLAALREWRRVTRPGGHLLLVVPDPTRSFDHRRSVTTLEHVRADFAQNTQEDDTTHVAEVLALHDLARDPDAGTSEEFRARVARNVDNRCLHHHVFDLTLLRAVLVDAGWQVRAQERVRPVHLLTWARKESA